MPIIGKEAGIPSHAFPQRVVGDARTGKRFFLAAVAADRRFRIAPQISLHGTDFLMTEKEVFEIARSMLIVALKLSLPVLLSGLVAGVVVSVLQSVTQIQEFTLTFVPKLAAVVCALAVLGHWMLMTMVDFIRFTYNHMPPVVR